MGLPIEHSDCGLAGMVMPANDVGSDVRAPEAATLAVGSLCRYPLRFPVVEERISHTELGAAEMCGGPCECRTNTVVFDCSVLNDLATALDDNELDAYLALLESTVTPRVAQMTRHASNGEVRGVLEAAHALVGGAGCYGLVALSAAARVVEADARGSRLEALNQAVAEVAVLVDVSLMAVARWHCCREAQKLRK